MNSELDTLIAELRKPNYKSDPTFERLCRALDALELARAQRNSEIYELYSTVSSRPPASKFDDLDAQLAAALTDKP